MAEKKEKLVKCTHIKLIGVLTYVMFPLDAILFPLCVKMSKEINNHTKRKPLTLVDNPGNCSGADFMY